MRLDSNEDEDKVANEVNDKDKDNNEDEDKD